MLKLTTLALTFIFLIPGYQALASEYDPMAEQYNAINTQPWESEHDRNQYQADIQQQHESYERQEQNTRAQYQSLSPAERLSECASTRSCAGAFAPRY